jgi:GNAT superfamily N-acetyltransferase
VHPDYRSQGVGSRLFEHAVQWAQEKNCRQLLVETQNVNVPACRFYARQGCVLGAINRYAYGDALDEVQLLWYRDL